MLTRFREFPLDGRNIAFSAKTLGIGIAILVLDRQLRGLGAARLAVDAVATPPSRWPSARSGFATSVARSD